MQYSPKLKTAMEEIKEILRKHDIAAVVILHTPGHSEYLNHFKTSYSCASIDELQAKFVLKHKPSDFNNEAERLNKLRDTANMLKLLSNVSWQTALNLLTASENTDKLLQANHFGGGHTSHTSQNN